jgi:YD repeat-containing protein
MTPLNLIPDAFLPTTRNELSPLLRNKKINTAEVIAFRKLSNMLTFLQALDYDKDASNGITISDGMGIVLEGESIDFAAELTEFKKTIPLRRVMSAAVTQNLISSDFIEEPGQALNHFYQAQEIEHSFKARASASVDTDANGEPNSITTNTYDADGNLLTYSSDTDANGEPNSITTNTYDADGNLLTESSDTDANGEANEIYTYTYNDDGNMLTISYDTNTNGEPNRIQTYTYDVDGNRLTFSDDTDANGEPNSIFTSTYDTDGNELTFGLDANADGEPNSITTNTYDADGNLLTESDDYNGNSLPNKITIYTYEDSSIAVNIMRFFGNVNG